MTQNDSKNNWVGHISDIVVSQSAFGKAPLSDVAI